MNLTVLGAASDKFLLILVPPVCVLSLLSFMLSATHLKRHKAHFFQESWLLPCWPRSLSHFVDFCSSLPWSQNYRTGPCLTYVNPCFTLQKPSSFHLILGLASVVFLHAFQYTYFAYIPSATCNVHPIWCYAKVLMYPFIHWNISSW